MDMSAVGPSTVVATPGPVSASATASKWQEACQRCKGLLDPKDAAVILAVPSYQHLKIAVSGMEQTYKDRKTAKVLERMAPFIEKIRSFSGVVDTAIQANPDCNRSGMERDQAGWWSRHLFLRTSMAIERIAEGFSDIARALPRFEEYQTLFTSAPRLNEVLVDLYELVVRFFINTIKLFRRHPIKNMLLSLWDNHEATARESISRIRRQGQVIDMESHAAKINADGSRHEEIKRLITHSRPMPVVNLPYFQIPLNQNPGFFGRAAELDHCTQALSAPNNTGIPKLFALHGIPGVGKTSIALAFPWREKTSCQLILWLPSDEATKLARGYVDAAAGLGLHQENASAEQDMEAVKGWLGSMTEKWLVVLDNVERGVLLGDHIPSIGNGSILVTSRDPESQFGLAGEGLKIESFAPDEARNFLLAQLPSLDSSDESLDTANTLVTQLGGLPLGIKQMAGFMRETGCSIRDLLAMIEDAEQHRKVRSYEGAFTYFGYPNTLARALDVPLSRLDHPTLNLLALFSTLDPDGIQDTVTTHLPATFQQFPGLFAPFHVTAGDYRILGKLRRYGLVDQHTARKLIIVHRLIQEATQHFMPLDLLPAIYDAALHLLRQGHPQSQATSDTLFPHWNTCSTYAPHILRLMSLQEKWSLRTTRPIDLFGVYFNCSWYLLGTGAMTKALELAQAAEASCDLNASDGRLQVSYLYNTYGVVALQHKDHKAAWDWFQKCLDIRMELLGEYEVNTCAVRGNQTLVLLNEKRYDQVVQRLLPFRDRAFTVMADLPVRVKTPIFDQLAMAYMSLGQFAEARTHLEISMDLSKQDNLPMLSQGSAYDYYVSGNIRMAQGELYDALRLHTIALDIRRQVLGSHIQTAASCYRVGDLLDRTGNQDSAVTVLLQSYKMYDELGLMGSLREGGKARSAWRMAAILRAQGKDDEAFKHAAEAEEIRVRHGGDPAKVRHSEDDFNALLNYMDS